MSRKITLGLLALLAVYFFLLRPTPKVSNTNTVVTPTPTPAHTLVTQGDWQLYSNPQQNFQIKVPKGWLLSPTVMTDPNFQIFFSNEDVGAPLELSTSGIWITITKHRDPLKFADLFKAPKGVVPNDEFTITKLNDLKINDLDAIKFTTQPGKNFGGDAGLILEYLVKSSNNVYEISFFSPLDSSVKTNEVLYSQIANSFDIVK